MLSSYAWIRFTLQFHPESVATAFGKKILENFRSITQEHWQKQDWQPSKKVRSFDLLALLCCSVVKIGLI